MKALINKIKRRFTEKRQYALNMLVSLFFVIVLIVLINFISTIHNVRKDFTEAGTYTLSSQSIQILKDLKVPLSFIGFFKPTNSPLRQFLDISRTYSEYSRYIDFENIDPDKSPSKAKEFGVKGYNTVIIKYGSRTHKTTDISERSITSGIKRLINTKQDTVCFTKGHGEGSLEGLGRTDYLTAKEDLEEEGYETKSVLLIKEKEVPKICSVLVVAGPEKPLTENEVNAITSFIDGGGTSLFLIEPKASSNLIVLLKQFGIVVRNDMIVDKVSKLYGGDYTVPVVDTYSNHEITKGFTLATFFPISRSVDALKTSKKSTFTVTSLLKTSENSWGETDIRGNKLRMNFNKMVDTPGPASLAVAVEGKKDETPIKLVVFGDASFVNNTHIGLSGNSDLFLNTINWLARKGELIGIRPKKQKSNPFVLTRTQGIILWCVYIGSILIIISGGIGVFLYRRRL